MQKYELILRRGYITSVSIVECAEIFKPGLLGQSHKSALLDVHTQLTGGAQVCSVWVVVAQKN